MGLMAGLAAVLLTGRIGSTRPNIALGFELEVITMVVLGGVSITGGVGGIVGVTLAVFVLGLTTFGLSLVNVPGIVISILNGALLIVSIAAPNLVARVLRRKDLTCNAKPSRCSSIRAARAEYRKRHDAIWPELAALLADAGVSNYSIHLDPETDILFAYLERRDDHQYGRACPPIP